MEWGFPGTGWSGLRVFAHLLSCSVMSNSLWPPWLVACQAPLSMGFPRQEFRSSLPFPAWDLPDLRDRTHISCASCIGRWILYHYTPWESTGLCSHLLNKWTLISSNPFSRAVGFQQETIIYILILSVFLLHCSWINLPRKHFRFNLKC